MGGGGGTSLLSAEQVFKSVSGLIASASLLPSLDQTPPFAAESRHTEASHPQCLCAYCVFLHA